MAMYSPTYDELNWGTYVDSFALTNTIRLHIP